MDNNEFLASFGAAFKVREISSGVCWLDLKESLNWDIAYLHYNNAKVKAAKSALAKVFGFTISSLVVHDYFPEEHNQISIKKEEKTSEKPCFF